MKQLSTFCGKAKGWKVLMGGIEWEGQALWFLQGAFSGGEREACHSPEAAGIEYAGVYEAENSVLGVRVSRKQPFTQEKHSYPLLVDQEHYLVCGGGGGVSRRQALFLWLPLCLLQSGVV